jgi:hypothetical protein
MINRDAPSHDHPALIKIVVLSIRIDRRLKAENKKT